jgi:hypothetical protein
LEDLQVIIDNARPHKSALIFKALGDVLLRSASPAEGTHIFLGALHISPPGFLARVQLTTPLALTTTLKAIINEIHSLEQFDAARLCKYLRVIFQATLPLNDTVALEIVNQIAELAHDSRRVDTPLPEVDIEWIIATVFNHAIDYYALDKEASCKSWASKAMELAEYQDDGGRLASTLRDRFRHLRFENNVVTLLNG